MWIVNKDSEKSAKIYVVFDGVLHAPALRPHFCPSGL